MAKISIHEGKRGPCYLCGKDSTKYVHVAAKSDSDVAAYKENNTTPNTTYSLPGPLLFCPQHSECPTTI